MQNHYDNHPLDLSYLTEMVGHNPAFMIEIFDTFIEQTPFYMAELEDALAQQNWDKVANCIHKIKPTFTYVGRNDVKGFLQQIEDQARNRDQVDQLPVSFEYLKTLLDAIYLQLGAAKIEVQSKFKP